MKCSFNSLQRVCRTIPLNCIIVWLLFLKQSSGDYNKHTKGLLMDVDYLISQLYVQRCAFVEIGEGVCSLFVELPLDGNVCGPRQVFLGQCSCTVLSSWQLCGRRLAQQRPEDCTLELECPATSARVHYRLCDLTGMSQWNPQCNCSQPQQEPLCGFRTCYSNPLPSSICSPRSPCGTASCDLALHGSLYSIRCDPSCKQHLPFCERPGPATSARREVSSDWTEWRPISYPDKSNVQQFVADCLTPDRKPAFDCIGPGLQCCGDEEVDCICEVKLEDGTLKAFRYSITFSADRPDHNSIKARSPNYKSKPQVWNRFIDLASKVDKSSDSLFAIQGTKEKNNQQTSPLKNSDGDRVQVELANKSQVNIKDVYQHINELISQTSVDSTLKNGVKYNEKVTNKYINIITTTPLLRKESLQETHSVKPAQDKKLSKNTNRNENIKNTLKKDRMVDNSRLAGTNHVINYISNKVEAKSSSISDKSKTSNSQSSQNYSVAEESPSVKVLNKATENGALSQINARTANNSSNSRDNEKSNGNEGINDNLNQKLLENSSSVRKEMYNHTEMNQLKNNKIINKDSEVKHQSPINQNNSDMKPDNNKNHPIMSKNVLANQINLTDVSSQPNREYIHNTISNNQDKINHEINKKYKIQNSKLDHEKNIKNYHNSQSNIEMYNKTDLSHAHTSSSKLKQVHVTKNDKGNASIPEITTHLDSQNRYEAKDQKVAKDILTNGLNTSINESNKKHSIRPGQTNKTTPALEFISDIVDLLPNSTPKPNTAPRFGTSTSKYVNVTSFFVIPSHKPLNIAKTNRMESNKTPKLTLANVARKIFSSPDILTDQKDPLNDIQGVDLLSLAVANYDEKGETTLDKLYDEPEPVLKDLNIESVDDKMANALSSVIGVEHNPQKSTWTQTNKKQKLSGGVATAKHNSSGSKLYAVATT